MAQSLESAQPSCRKHTLVVPPTEASDYSTSPSLLTIAHRGASSHLPEHTVEAYRLALELGASFIEPDIVSSSDGVLFAMHTVDLNITTDVEQVFAQQGPWYSPTQGRVGYWSYNFTWEQIQQLRVRQRLPAFRTQVYDGMLRIPSLDDILDTLRLWNEIDLPVRRNVTGGASGSRTRPSPLQKYKSGLYLEIKEAKWLKDDAGIDLIDLIFRHISQKQHLYWNDLLPCFEEVRFDEYIVPGLVVQSFYPLDLQEFHRRWQDKESGMTEKHSEPPYILLVNREHCFQDEFWFRVGDSWRSFLSGLGCEKTCLTEGPKSHAIIQKAIEFSLVLHPWTERPESSFWTFPSIWEEMMFLKCNTSGVVHGLFSESVDIAVRVAHTPCPSEATKHQHPVNESQHCRAQGSSVVLAAAFGAVVALAFSCGTSLLWKTKRPTDATRIPTSELPASVELT